MKMKDDTFRKQKADTNIETIDIKQERMIKYFGNIAEVLGMFRGDR